MIKKIIIGLWVILVMVVLAIVAVFFAISNGYIGYMPPIEELENPSYKFATEVYSEDGKVLGTWSLEKENRVYVGYDELSPYLIQALIATEDVRFSSHSGVDAKALARAVVKRGILMQSQAGGGSTITQQLSKLLFSPRAESVSERVLQKPIEWVIATELERYYTKEEILSLYLNKFDFLNNSVGVKTASNTYFGKDPKDLLVEEAAVLIGMCKNPAYYNPLRFPDRVEGRRNVVLHQMLKANYISQHEYDSLKNISLTLNYKRVDHKEGSASYLREYLRKIMTAQKPEKKNYRGWQKQQFYDDSVAWATNPLFGWCAKNKKKDGSNYNIYTDGLKIYTTVNSHMQAYAEEAVEEHIGGYLQDRFFAEKAKKKTSPYSWRISQADVDKILARNIKQSDRYRTMKADGASEAEIQKAFNTPERMTVFSYKGDKDTLMTPLDSIKYYKHFLRTGFVSMDPLTGHVKAYVGGPNYTNFQYDMAMVGRRQVGSTMKPFVYTLAMENGFSPCDEIRKAEVTINDENGLPWSPRTSDPKKRYGEMVTLKWGLANSDNWITASLMAKLNPYNLVRLVHNFGVLNQEIDPVISLCLGPCSISVGEMVSAYTAFANKGIRVAPLFVTRIEDNEGNVIASFTPQMEEVISVTSAYKMLTMLRAVINEGTGGRVRRYGITADMGGKTGTTNNNSDGWFIGFTPTLVSGAWVGGEEPDIRFDTMADGQGASMALPIWTIYMKKVFADKSLGYSQEDTFQLPEGFNPCGDEIIDEQYYQPSNTESILDDLFN